tara:strand:- start:465 stop:587 length:123 start_codon:yes stop_codon:yes gene_type:complete
VEGTNGWNPGENETGTVAGGDAGLGGAGGCRETEREKSKK